MARRSFYATGTIRHPQVNRHYNRLSAKGGQRLQPGNAPPRPRVSPELKDQINRRKRRTSPVYKVARYVGAASKIPSSTWNKMPRQARLDAIMAPDRLRADMGISRVARKKKPKRMVRLNPPPNFAKAFGSVAEQQRVLNAPAPQRSQRLNRPQAATRFAPRGTRPARRRNVGLAVAGAYGAGLGYRAIKQKQKQQMPKPPGSPQIKKSEEIEKFSASIIRRKQMREQKKKMKALGY